MIKKYIIAIDGPAASGKSTTAKLLAIKMKYIYIDSGAMYRVCALAVLLDGIALDDLPALTKMLNHIVIKIEYSEKGNRIYLNDRDVTSRIREADISKLSSKIATIKIVRKKMVELQREIGKNDSVIMDGRDIGTVVFPDADFKFFMIASVKTRAIRRWKEAKEKGENLTLSEIEKEIIWRDKNDSSRKISPLIRASDAIDVNTSNMTIEDQTEFIFNYIRERKNE